MRAGFSHGKREGARHREQHVQRPGVRKNMVMVSGVTGHGAVGLKVRVHVPSEQGMPGG